MCDSEQILCEETYQTIIKKWLKNKDVKIKSYSLAPLSDKLEGYIGDHNILKIFTEENGKLSEHRFFVKKFPQTKTAIELANGIKGFDRESSFFNKFVAKYEQVLPGYKPSFAPKFLFGNNKVVIFEDLSTENYGPPRTKYPDIMDFNHIKIVLDALAVLHSSSLAYEEIRSKQLGKKYRFFSDDNMGIYRRLHFTDNINDMSYRWAYSGLKALCSLVNELPGTKLTKENLVQLIKQCDVIEKNNLKFRRVLGHNDLWNKNMLFKYKSDSPVGVKLVDYQLLTYFPPIFDVGFFMILNSNDDVKNQSFMTLLRHYYSSLSEELRKYDLYVETILPFSEIKESLIYMLPVIQLKITLYVTMVCINEDYVTKLSKDEEQFKEFMLEDRGPFCLESFRTDSYYRERLTASMRDLEDVMFSGTPAWLKI